MSLRDEYDKVFRKLSRVELQSGEDLSSLELPDLFRGGADKRWLGFYTEEGLQLALGRYGLWDDFARLGYAQCRVETMCDDPEEHLLRIWSDRPHRAQEPLLELVVRRELLQPREELAEHLPRDFVGVLNVEWLQLQRPGKPFTPTRPPLPGQRYPGLGLGREILELLRQACKRIGLEGLVTVPSYFHNAYLYAEEFAFVDPAEQGMFLALCRDVIPAASDSIAAASWAIALGMVVADDTPDDGIDDEEPFRWFHDVMLAPVSDRLKAFASAPWYGREVEAAQSHNRFRVLDTALRQELEARGILPLDNERIATWVEERR